MVSTLGRKAAAIRDLPARARKGELAEAVKGGGLEGGPIDRILKKH